MKNWFAIGVFVVFAVFAISPATIRAQQSGATLTALDFYQIHELNARFCYDLDSGNGNLFSSLFTPDGVYVDETGKTTTGSNQLSALAAANPAKGPTNMSHYYVNLVVDPVPGGAYTKSYISIVAPHAENAPNELISGQYWDDLVKTPAGWRIKKRTFYNVGIPYPETQPLTTSIPRFVLPTSPQDRATADNDAQLYQLLARYAQSWDRPTALDGGSSWANLFTADGTLVDAAGKATTGRANLQALNYMKGPWNQGTYFTNVVAEPVAPGIINFKAYYVRHVSVLKNGALPSTKLLPEANVPRPAPTDNPSETWFGLSQSHPGPDRPVAMLFGQLVSTAEGLRLKKLYLVGPNTPVPNMTAPSNATVANTQTRHQTSTLTAADYANIQNLYARYAHGIDSKANNGNGDLYASTYTPNSFFRIEFDNFTHPRSSMTAEYARNRSPDKPVLLTTYHKAYDILLTPAPWGVAGQAYLPDGSYYDLLVRTPEGWRFRGRNYRYDMPWPSYIDEAQQKSQQETRDMLSKLPNDASRGHSYN